MLLLASDALKGYGLNRIFAFAKKTRFEGLEVVHDASDFDSQNPEYISFLSKEYSLPVVNYEICTKKNSSENKIRKALEIAHGANVKRVVLTAPKRTSRGVLSFLGKDIPELRKKLKIEICLTNPKGELIFGFLPEDSMNNMKDLKKFGEVCLDTSHLIKKRQNLLKTIEELTDALKVIHFSDAHGEKLYLLPSHEGEVPLESMFQKLKKKKYEGDFVLKVIPSELKAGNDEKVEEKLKSMVEFYKEYFL